MPLTFTVLSGPMKGWRWTSPDGQSHDGAEYPDLRLVKDEDPRNVRRTFEFDTEPPNAVPDTGRAVKTLSTQLMVLRSKGVDPASVEFTMDADGTNWTSA